MENLPRTDDPASFQSDALSFLKQSRSALGDMFMIQEGAPIFSRAPDCSAVIAVFGKENLREIFLNTEAYAMPASAAPMLGLPAQFALLNRSLHSMKGQEHAAHKRALGALLGETRVPEAERVMRACVDTWSLSKPQPLLARMRELSLELAALVLLGEDRNCGLAILLQEYFLLRRQAAASAPTNRAQLQPTLLAKAHALDLALRRRLRDGSAHNTVFSRLLDPAAMSGLSVSEDEAAGHANILFVSAAEPVAVCLTWTFLLLSQRAALYGRLRDGSESSDDILLEALRLLPPNAFMVRVATQPMQLAGSSIPARSEIILCPLLSHRDESVFPQSTIFLPQRWRRSRPSAYEYFPFGAGGHVCVGRGLAMALLRTAFGFLVKHFDIVLSEDQSIDWRINVMFMPRQEITVRFEPAGRARGGGKWNGPVSSLIEFADE